MIAQTNSIALRMLVDRTGSVDHLYKAMARRSFVPVHDRDHVLTDVAVMLADGGEAIRDINVLRHQSQVLSRWLQRRGAASRSVEEKLHRNRSEPMVGHGPDLRTNLAGVAYACFITDATPA